MFIFNYFKNFLSKFGFFQKNGKVLFLGLANAGKTSLLGILKNGVFKQYDPTIGTHNEEIIVGNMKLKAFDLGGHEAVRKTWKNYYADISGIFFLIDSSNEEAFETSNYELQKILNCPELENKPIAILGNKIDLRNAISEQELRKKFMLPDNFDSQQGEEEEINGHPVKLFMCSLSKNVGYLESFKWISKFVK